MISDIFKDKNTRELIGCLFAATLLVVLFFAGLELRGEKGDVIEMPYGWELQRGSKIYENISLEEMTEAFDDIKTREAIFLSHPLDVETHGPLTLRIYSRLSAVKVMVDDHQIYSYGFVDVSKHKMVGSGYHFVLLPPKYHGKMLKIELLTSMDDALRAAPEIVLTPSPESISMFARERIFGIFSGLFMFMVGLAIIIISIRSIYVDKRFYPLAIIGLFSCGAGIWSLSTIKAMQLFSGDVTLNTILEYMSMYMLPVPMLFLSLHFRRTASPKARNVIKTVTVIAALYFFTAIFLQVSGIIEVTKIVQVFHFLLIPYAMCLIFVGSSKWRRMKGGERMFQIGLYLVAGICVLEISVYYVINTVYKISSSINNVVSPFAMLTLDLVMTIGFLMEIYDMRLRDNERERLQKLACRDQMTGLMNRGMCTRRFQELRASGEDFVILNMDLNGLKAVNDNYGHLTGDEYIRIFAETATKALGGNNDLYRVGGDEFLYISTEMTEDDLYRKAGLIKKLEKIIQRENGIDFSIDASYGIAGSRESGFKDPEDVYKIADKRMYEMKKSQKKERN